MAGAVSLCPTPNPGPEAALQALAACVGLVLAWEALPGPQPSWSLVELSRLLPRPAMRMAVAWQQRPGDLMTTAGTDPAAAAETCRSGWAAQQAWRLQSLVLLPHRLPVPAFATAPRACAGAGQALAARRPAVGLGRAKQEVLQLLRRQGASWSLVSGQCCLHQPCIWLYPGSSGLISQRPLAETPQGFACQLLGCTVVAARRCVCKLMQPGYCCEFLVGKLPGTVSRARARQ